MLIWKYGKCPVDLYNKILCPFTCSQSHSNIKLVVMPACCLSNVVDVAVKVLSCVTLNLSSPPLLTACIINHSQEHKEVTIHLL